MMNQPATAKTVYLPTPDGQERLATQSERDDVRRTIEAPRLENQADASRGQITKNPRSRRETGDQLNRFLLCAIVSESSRQIKVSAQKAGASLPMTMIVRGVLRSYLLAASDECGPLAGATLDLAGLKRLNEKVLTSEIARHTRDSVKNSEARLARAERLGDATGIKVERDGLKDAKELRDRLAEKVC